MVESAYDKAQSVLLNRVFFNLDESDIRQFMHFTLPANLQITQLPEDVLFDDGELRFTSNYRHEQQQVLVERRLVVPYLSRVCTPDQHANWKKLIAVMRADQQAMVMFRVTGK